MSKEYERIRVRDKSRDMNIRMEDCQYFWQQDLGRVVCILEHCEDMFSDFLLDSFTDTVTYRNEKEIKKLKMPSKFVGIAQCSSDDEFDLELGEQIAFLRMKEKFMKAFMKRAQAFFDMQANHLWDWSQLVNQIFERSVRNMNHRNEEIGKLATNTDYSAPSAEELEDE